MALTARPTEEQDLPCLVEWIRGLALHEGRPEAATLTLDGLRHWLLEERAATAWMLEAYGQPAGYAVFYPVFSTFKGAAGLYLEDIYILPGLRGRGLGRQAMALVADHARDEGYRSLQWSCLADNQGSLAFYERLGAHRKPDGVGFELALDGTR